MNKVVKSTVVYVFVAILGLFLLAKALTATPGREKLNVLEFRKLLDAHQIDTAKLYDRDHLIKGELKDGKKYEIKFPDRYTDEITDQVVNAGVSPPGRQPEGQPLGHAAVQLRPLRPDHRRHRLLHEPGPGRRQPGHELRESSTKDRQQGHPEGHLRRRGRRRRGHRGAPGDQGLPREPPEVPPDGGQDPQGRPPLRPSGDGQDPPRPGRGRRGRCAVLLHLRVGLRRNVRRCRGLPGAGPVRAGQELGAGHRLRRRDRRRRPPPGRRPRRRPRRAGADPQPAARRDGRVRPPPGRHPHRRHQPARHPRPGAAPSRPLRPPDRGRPARPRGPQGHPQRPRQGQAAGQGGRPRRHGPAHPRLHRRRPGQPDERGHPARRPQGPRPWSPTATSTRPSTGSWPAPSARAGSSPRRRSWSSPTTRAATPW